MFIFCWFWIGGYIAAIIGIVRVVSGDQGGITEIIPGSLIGTACKAFLS